MSEPGPGHNSASAVAADQLRSFVERIERLNEEKKSLSEDIRDVYEEARGTGFDTKCLRYLITLRKMDQSDRAERDAIVDMYMTALGMI